MPDSSALLLKNVGILDFREKTAFDERHIRHSLNIAGLKELLNRFSWLPPPKREDKAALELVAICSKGDEQELKVMLRRWNLIAVFNQDDTSFWQEAEQQGHLIFAGQPDKPAILFEPAAIVETAVLACEAVKCKVTTSSCTVLDLGCGAARDIAWIVRRKSNYTWLATGLDNLNATIQRASLLRNDMHLGNTEKSHIERLIWAQSTDKGTLQALQLGSTSKSKGITFASDDSDDSLQSFAKIHLPHTTYDLILLIRFLPRTLLLKLPTLSHVGTVIAISQFTTIEDEPDYPSPDSSKRFAVGDVEMLLENWGHRQWRLIEQVIHRAEDGRPIRSVLLQRIE